MLANVKVLLQIILGISTHTHTQTKAYCACRLRCSEEEAKEREAHLQQPLQQPQLRTHTFLFCRSQRVGGLMSFAANLYPVLGIRKVVQVPSAVTTLHKPNRLPVRLWVGGLLIAAPSHTHTHTHTGTHIDTHTHTQARAHTHKHTHTHTQSERDRHTHTHTEGDRHT